MKKQLIGFFICMSMLLTSLPIVGAVNHENQVETIKTQQNIRTFMIGKIRGVDFGEEDIGFDIDVVFYIIFVGILPIPSAAISTYVVISNQYAGYIGNGFICAIFNGTPRFGGP